jgi:hypothetical protein
MAARTADKIRAVITKSPVYRLNKRYFFGRTEISDEKGGIASE